MTLTVAAPSIFVLLGSLAAAELFPSSIESPVYPILASQAQISGVVRLRLTLDKTGSIVDATAVSGHKLLARAAMENIKLWKFLTCDGMSTPREIEIVYDYRLDGEESVKPTTRFRYEHPFKVIVTSQAMHWVPSNQGSPVKRSGGSNK